MKLQITVKVRKLALRRDDLELGLFFIDKVGLVFGVRNEAIAALRLINFRYQFQSESQLQYS